MRKPWRTSPGRGYGNGVLPRRGTARDGQLPEVPVRLWNLAERVRNSTLPRTALGVRALAFSPDGMLLAMAGEDGTTASWGVTEARWLGALRASERGLQSVAFSDDGLMRQRVVRTAAYTSGTWPKPLHQCNGSNKE